MMLGQAIPDFLRRTRGQTPRLCPAEPRPVLVNCGGNSAGIETGRNRSRVNRIEQLFEAVFFLMPVLRELLTNGR